MSYMDDRRWWKDYLLYVRVRNTTGSETAEIAEIAEVPKLYIGAQGISLFLVTQHLGGLESKLLMGFST